MGGYKERKDTLLQVISNYSESVLKSLECPFLWEMFDYYDTIDFEEYARNHNELSLREEHHWTRNQFDSEVEMFVWLAESAVKHYLAFDVEASLKEVCLLYTDIEAFQSMEDTEYKRAGFYVAQSCEVVLHLLNGDEVKAGSLKEAMTQLNTAVEIGHLSGIRGLIMLEAHEMMKDAVPFLDQAISATHRHFEYVYGKAKIIARLRRKDNSKNVTPEEIQLFQEIVSSGHAFAVPQLLTTLQAAIRNQRPENREDLQNHFDTSLENAWTSRDSIAAGSNGLGRLARIFENADQYERSRELFELALTKEADSGLCLHYYGGFLIRHGDRGEDDKKEGFECLTKAGHAAAFKTFLQYFFDDRHAFAEKESFPDYLEKFISCNKKVSYKRIYAYFGHRYYLLYGDFQQSVSYLQRAINFDLEDLTFEFKWNFKPPYSLFSKIGIRHVPDTVDLTCDVGYILDPRQNFTSDSRQVPRDQVISEFKAWWETSGLKPVRQYPGYQSYQQKKQGNWNSWRSSSDNRSSSSEAERPSSSWRSHNSDESHPPNDTFGESRRRNHYSAESESRNTGTGADSANWRRRD